MNTYKRSSIAQRAGAVLGRVCKYCLQTNERFDVWVSSHCLPVALGKFVVWTVRLSVLGIGIYITFWLVLLPLFVLVAALVMKNETPEVFEGDDEYEWRQGDAGFGIYTSGGERIDPHNPNDPYDD